MAEFTKEDVAGQIDNEGFEYWVEQGYYRSPNFSEVIDKETFQLLEELQALLKASYAMMEKKGFIL